MVIEPDSSAVDGLFLALAAYSFAAILVLLLVRWAVGMAWLRWRRGRWPRFGLYPLGLLAAISTLVAGITAWAYGWSEPGIVCAGAAVLVAWLPLAWRLRRRPFGPV